MKARKGILALALLAGGQLGCQLFVDLSNRQCKSDGDCKELLGHGYFCPEETRVCARVPASELDAGRPPLPEQWSCLRENLPSSDNPPDDAPASDEVELSIAVVEYTTRRIPTDLTARACLPSDVDCERPYADNLTLDDEGYLTVKVPYGFTGRLEMEVPGFLPMLWYANRPIYEDIKQFGASVVSESELQSIAERSDDELSEEGGLVIFALFDCNEEAAPGLTVSRTDDAPDLPFYFDGPLPDQDLKTSRISSELSHDGSPISAGGFFNAKPGFVGYEVRLAETDDLVATASVEIKAGYMTTVAFYPGDY